MGKTFEKKLPYKKAICYSGYREGQCPTGEMPSKEQISEDLHLLVADGYGYIRMYEPNAHAVTALQVIREEKLPRRKSILQNVSQVRRHSVMKNSQHMQQAMMHSSID